MSRRDIANWFIQVLNPMPGISIGNQAVAATAVATRSSSQVASCAIPVGVCSSAVTPPPPAGTWLQRSWPGKSGGTGNLTGNFMWADYSPPGGGASELGENLAGPGVCNLPATGTQVGEAGVISSLAAYWNSRFGIYEGNVNRRRHTGLWRSRVYRCTGSWPAKFNAFAISEAKGELCRLSGRCNDRVEDEWNRCESRLSSNQRRRP